MKREQLMPTPEPSLPPQEIAAIEGLLSDTVEHLDDELRIVDKWRHGQPPLTTDQIWKVIKERLKIGPDDQKLLMVLAALAALFDVSSLSNLQIAEEGAKQLMKDAHPELSGHTEESLTIKLLSVINELRQPAKKTDA